MKQSQLSTLPSVIICHPEHHQRRSREGKAIAPGPPHAGQGRGLPSRHPVSQLSFHMAPSSCPTFGRSSPRLSLSLLAFQGCHQRDLSLLSMQLEPEGISGSAARATPNHLPRNKRPTSVSFLRSPRKKGGPVCSQLYKLPPERAVRQGR